MLKTPLTTAMVKAMVYPCMFWCTPEAMTVFVGFRMAHLNVQGRLNGSQVFLKRVRLVPPQLSQVRIMQPLIADVVVALAMPYEVYHLLIRFRSSLCVAKLSDA